MNQAFADFQAACNECSSFVTRAHTLHPTTNAYLLTDAERNLVTVAAFLRLFIAWETFAEDSFLLYMQGTPSRTGKRIRRYVFPKDYQHARQILQHTHPKFVDWSTPDTIKKLAPIAFRDGEPFISALSASHTDFMDLKTIRNATAHKTASTQTALEGLAARKLGPLAPVAGITVTALLLSTKPNSAPPSTIFQSYIDLLLTVATLIAEG